MVMLGPLGFALPWLLTALLALPVLWWLLRAVPPAPVKRLFPAVALLLGLKDAEVEADKTPWWLLALRMAALGLAIIAFAGPVIHPQRDALASDKPLLLLVDGTWADARDWPRRMERLGVVLDQAASEGRTVALMRLSDRVEPASFQSAEAVQARIAGLAPAPMGLGDLGAWADALPEGAFDSYWLSDGLDYTGRADLARALQERGDLRVFQTAWPVMALYPARFADGKITLRAARLPADLPLQAEIAGFGPDPAGIERELARQPLAFAAGQAETEVVLDLPPELRNRINRFEIAGQRSAGAVSLTDDSLKRRKVAVITARDDREGANLLQPAHYLRQALQPVAELVDGTLSDVLRAAPDVIILADVAKVSQAETDAVLDWLDGGGLLLRFAGPDLAASDIGRPHDDPLMPVRLREGGRSLGGAMSWGDPKTLAPFADTSPFYGLTIPPDVQITAQVLAQPDADLGERTIAALEDGTPLVTRKMVGTGQVVLFHVTANAEWSTLPLSGLFMQMLERLAVSTRQALDPMTELTGQTYVPQVSLDAYGARHEAQGRGGVAGDALAAALRKGPDLELAPGLYAGPDRRVALNAMTADRRLTAARWPAAVTVEGAAVETSRNLKGPVLSLAIGLMLLDILASLWISGRLGRKGGRLAVWLAVAISAMPHPSQAQDNLRPPPADTRFAVDATRGVVLAHVLTGDDGIDDTAFRGLQGLGQVLYARTSIEPLEPMGVDIEADELSIFPFLYWPISDSQPLPTAQAYAKLNDYMRSGGMIFFDSRDGDLGGSSAESQYLERLAAGLDIPPLEVMPQDHVLTRTFYLLQDFPGRQSQGAVWVEAARQGQAPVAGDPMPFRNQNDGVTPVVIGGNDWAGAWAIDDDGLPLLPVGRGFAGEDQREMAYRFGVNLIMHVLTGNYKSDQVHVPALLDRLGQ